MSRSVVTLLLTLAPALAARPLGAQPPRRPDTAPEVVAVEATDPPARHVPVFRPVTFGEYGAAMFGPRAVFGSVAGAGLDQTLDHPKQWPKNGRGYADRLGYRVAEHAIDQTFVIGLSAVLQQRRVTWAPCGDCAGVAPRITHALVMPFVVQSPHGFGLSPLVPLSKVAGGLATTALYPGGFSVRAGLRNALTGVLFSAAGSTAREFWPFHWRPPGF